MSGVISRSPSPIPSLGNVDPNDAPSSAPIQPSDPLAILPSSPPQIYLNLLILEASLRSQYLTLRARRRQNTFFLLLLVLWVAGFAYLLFLRPREDGSGVGGSVYWVVEMGEKVALMGGVFTGMLVWGTGQWERGVRWPRRWVAIANRGLRTMNAKIVIVKGSWWQEMLGHLAFLFPYSSLFPTQEPSFHHVDLHSEKRGSGMSHPEAEDSLNTSQQEDLSPGGDYIKLLLLPKPFSPDFRENWELYRVEYWEKENERRAILRQSIKMREKEQARQHGGVLWWTGWRRQRNLVAKGDIEKTQHRHQPEKESKGSSSVRGESHSRNTSRSSTPSTLDLEERPTSARLRRGSTTTSASERRKKARSSPSSEAAHIAKFTPINRPA